MFKIHDVVKTWWADGDPMGHGWVYGVVEHAGPKTFTVRWESGLRNRRPHGFKEILPVTDAEIVAEVRRKLIPPSFYLKRDPQTDAEWDALAAFKGVESGAVLKEQVRLADEILLEIVTEEEAERARKQGV